MKHNAGTREEWMAARVDVLKAEKDLTQKSDELSRLRQELPWGRIEKEYRFETERERPQGSGPVGTFAAMCGVDSLTYQRERPGMSAFALEDGVVHHAYSTYARGLDAMWGAYQWLDRAPKGRNEAGAWWKRHDEYSRPNT